MTKIAVSLIAACALAVGCRTPPQTTRSDGEQGTDPMVKELRDKAARFAPVDLTADVSALPENEQRAVAKLVEAAKVFDALFLRQVWAGNETMLMDLVRDTSDLGQARLHLHRLASLELADKRKEKRGVGTNACQI